MDSDAAEAVDVVTVHVDWENTWVDEATGISRYGT